MQEEFKSINQETICAANKVAERMLKELQNTKTDYQQSRELYFACIEIHSIFYSDETEDIVYKYVINLLNLLNKKNIGFMNDSISYNIFWNVLITSDINGEKCDVDDFLKNLRMKFGENTNIIIYLTEIAENLYPNCNNLKLESYKFEFIKNEQKYIISFCGRISKTEISKMLKQLKNNPSEFLYKKILMYLNQHHLEYSNFQWKKSEVDKEFCTEFNCCSTYYLRNNDYLYDVQKFDNYYLIMYTKNWIDEELCLTNICLMKYECEKFNIICQRYNEYFDYDYGQDYDYKQLSFRNIFDNDILQIENNENIIPMVITYDKLFELLMNMDQIKTVKDVKEIINK